MDNLIIMKFGGSCLQDRNSFKQVIEIINDYIEKTKILLVTSALKGITNKLIDFYEKSCKEAPECETIVDSIQRTHSSLINQVFEQKNENFQESIKFLNQNIDELRQLGHVVRLIRPSKDLKDLILSYGEKLSTFILNQYLISTKFKAKFFSSDELIVTDDNFGRATPLLDETKIIITEKLNPILNSGKFELLCITGYYGATKDKKITTLGRGGTDLTAAILAYSLGDSFKCRVIYWKDVKGFLNADPRVAKKTALLKQISYVEAKELAFFGTKVLHPLCLDINEKGNIPSEIRDFNEPNSQDFTTITKDLIQDDKIIKAVSSIYKLTMVNLESDTMVPLSGTASKLFSLLGDNNIHIVFISQSSSENNITFGVDYDDSKKVSFLLRNSEFFGEKWFNIKIDNEISLVAIIGWGVLNTPGIAGKVFTTLGDNNINIKAIAQGSSKISFTAIIDRKNCEKAINILYEIFIGDVSD